MPATGQNTHRQRRGRWPRHSLFALVWVVFMLGWWLMIVDSPAYFEVLAGLAAAILSALLMLRVLSHSGIRFCPRLGWLRWLRHLPWGVLHDTAVLLAVLWRRIARRERPQSAFRLVHFPTGGDDPESAARRAFATVATALAPNTYIIGFDRERGVALVHQLAPTRSAQVQRAVVGAASA